MDGFEIQVSKAANGYVIVARHTLGGTYAGGKEMWTARSTDEVTNLAASISARLTLVCEEALLHEQVKEGVGGD